MQDAWSYCYHCVIGCVIRVVIYAFCVVPVLWYGITLVENCILYRLDKVEIKWKVEACNFGLC